MSWSRTAFSTRGCANLFLRLLCIHPSMLHICSHTEALVITEHNFFANHTRLSNKTCPFSCMTSVSVVDFIKLISFKAVHGGLKGLDAGHLATVWSIFLLQDFDPKNVVCWVVAICGKDWLRSRGAGELSLAENSCHRICSHVWISTENV